MQYGQEVANGISVNAKLEYLRRTPLFNNTDYSIIKSDKPFLSNNPLDPTNNFSAAFEPSRLAKLNVFAKFTFNNKYISRPDRKINVGDDKFPVLYLGFENAFAATQQNGGYQFASASIRYDLALDNKGTIGLNTKAGKFWNARDISFSDFKHFNGNQTHVGTSDRYLNVFNLLPYYSNSTNDAFVELHSEYCDNGFVMNKLPLLNLLKTNLILGFHTMAVPNRAPYSEVSVGLDKLGFGKFKLLRVDYVRSFQNGVHVNGIVFGLKFLDILGD